MFDRFSAEFAAEADRVIPAEMREAVMLSDGEIPGSDFTLDLACSIRDAGPWGQGFPEPVFDGIFGVAGEQRPVGGGRHAKLKLLPRGTDHPIDAIAFNREPPLPRMRRARCRWRTGSWSMRSGERSGRSSSSRSSAPRSELGLSRGTQVRPQLLGQHFPGNVIRDHRSSRP